MNPTIALLRRYNVTLFLACIAILATTTIAQTVRLRYLEERHQQMFRDFGNAQFDMQGKINELAADCAKPAGQ